MSRSYIQASWVRYQVPALATCPKSDRLASWGKLLKFVGPVTAIGLGDYAIYQGDSPSSVILGVASGVVGGVAVGAVVTLIAPGLAAVAVGVAAAAGGAILAGAATWAYQELLPQHVREKIDEGIHDAWRTAADPVGNVLKTIFS